MSAGLALSGCAGTTTPSPAAPAPTPTWTAGPTNADQVHRLVVQATGCWSGGVWSDALSESGGPDVDRCARVLLEAYGSVDRVRLERLRAVEAVEVHELAERLQQPAAADPAARARVEGLVSLLYAVSDAERETMAARRAADRIKKDIAGEREPGKRPADEREAVAPLGSTAGLQRLLDLDAGALRAEARGIALMCAMDRMQSARGLPKHLKVYAVEGPYRMLFGVAPPAVPDDATESLKGGVWLGYLSEVAHAAGHPVPSKAATVDDKELLAWGGVLAGFSDRLREAMSGISDATELRRVVDGTVRRLDTEYRASEASLVLR